MAVVTLYVLRRVTWGNIGVVLGGDFGKIWWNSI